MFCPRCATQNLDGAKFCRACGTNLETVALALANQLDPATLCNGPKQLNATSSALQKRSVGLGKIVRGTGLLGASLLVGLAFGLFSNDPDWVVLWAVFGGWMGCWGIISLVAGIAAFLETRILLAGARETAKQIGPQTSPLEISAQQKSVALPAADLSQPASITEHTTRTLVNRQS